MTFHVRIAKLARRDIERNAEWWAQHHSREQAERWFHTVHEQVQTLDQFPESHALSVENDDLPFELRDRLVGLGSRRSYRAVFTIRGDTVFVLRVRPAAEQRLHPLDLPEEWLD
jgi:plasmid stabilization system protein ParE